MKPANVPDVPSPVGHVLGGALAGGIAADVRRPWWRAAAILGLLGVGADLDFLIGLHSQHSHSVGAAALVGLAAFAVSGGRWRWALAASLAYGSHILLDWLGDDTTPPIGVMALWPFSGGYYQSDLHWFMAVYRRYWLPGFMIHNLTAVVWEVVLLGPPAALVWWRRRRHCSSSTEAES